MPAHDPQLCSECNGAQTRSPYTPDQPADDQRCASCFYTVTRADRLLDLATLDDTLKATHTLESFAGCLVDWHGHIGMLVRCADGATRIQVLLPCSRCAGNSMLVFLGTGLHRGAWPYVYDFSGTYLTNLRDHDYCCASCAQKATQRAQTPAPGLIEGC